jgi:secreted trypsin-like serine protease
MARRPFADNAPHMCARFRSGLPLPRRVTTAAAAAVLLAAAALPSGAGAVANGTPARPRAARWEATLVQKLGTPVAEGHTAINIREQCSGALIAPDVMLSAGHCVAFADPGEVSAYYEVLVGNQPLSSGRDSVVGVREVRVDPAFAVHTNPQSPDSEDSDSASGDMSLIVLDHPVTGVRPLRLASSWPAPGTPVRLFGHGTTPDTAQTDTLELGTMTIGATARCAQTTPAFVDAANMGCAEGLSEACGGDSGGPLVTGYGANARLVGVVSFTTALTDDRACGSGPSFFSKVAAGRSWIDAQLRQLAKES